MPGIDADGINLKISLRMEPENFSQDGTKKSLVAGLVAARFSGMQSRSAQRTKVYQCTKTIFWSLFSRVSFQRTAAATSGPQVVRTWLALRVQLCVFSMCY